MIERVGIVAMGEAGNLGDDLILIRTIDAIYRGNPAADVRFLSHGVPVNWASVSARLGWVNSPTPVPLRREVPGRRTNTRSFEGSDLVIFGGGGLLQNSHSVHEPYHWLSHLPHGATAAPVVAMGLGLGPFDPQWRTRLAKGSPFAEAFLRDQQSRELADEFGWESELCQDIVTGDVRDWFGAEGGSPDPKAVGVALRAWPGLDVREVARVLEKVTVSRGADRIIAYVLEDKPWDHTDLKFTHEVLQTLDPSLTTHVHTYLTGDVPGFVDGMLAPAAALSMKLHSSIVWGGAGTELVPIIYAPKVASLFGRPYNGLEVLEEVVELPLSNEPHAAQVVEELVSGRRELPECQAGPYFTRWDALRYRGVRTGAGVARRVTSVVERLR